MRFHGHVEFWVEVGDLDDIQQLVVSADTAVRAALGRAAIKDPESGAVSGHFWEPIDDVARAALDREDVGHGLYGKTFEASGGPS